MTTGIQRRTPSSSTALSPSPRLSTSSTPTPISQREAAADARMAAAISLKGASKTFGSDSNRVDALIDIDLDVGQAEFVAVVGASGCGKSTLLRLVAGLLAPTRGEVLIGGRRIDGPDAGIGIVFQTPVLLPWRTVRRNVELQLDIRGI